MSKEVPSSKVMFNRAKALERDHRVEEAKELYERILHHRPDHKSARRALAALNASAARAVAPLTEADFNRVLALSGSSLARAEAEAARLRRLHPGQPALENLHGVILVQMGAYREAVALFGRVLEIEPRFTDAMSNLASALCALNRNEEAVQWYERLLSGNNKDPDIFFNYANTLRNLGRSHDAINAYKHALNLRPLYPAAYYNMGNVLNLLGHTEEAQTCYENVLEIDPDHDKATRSLAQLHARARRSREALVLYQGLLARNPGDVDALLGVAICLINAGDEAAAIDALARVVKLAPSAEAPRFLLDALRGESRDAMPAEYTRGLFDGYADRFEQDLVVNLEYSAPAELLALLDEATPQARQYTDALDVGCGTGLAGEVFRSRVTRLTGIDMSSAMLAKAEEKGVYDALLAGDAVELVRDGTDTFDLVTCCDTLPYIGDLVPLFTAVGARTTAGAHFLCTTELAETSSYRLQNSARFAHAAEYVIQCASAAGFDTLAQKTIRLRRHRDGWTTGGVYCFVRRA